MAVCSRRIEPSSSSTVLSCDSRRISTQRQFHYVILRTTGRSNETEIKKNLWNCLSEYWKFAETSAGDRKWARFYRSVSSYQVTPATIRQWLNFPFPSRVHPLILDYRSRINGQLVMENGINSLVYVIAHWLIFRTIFCSSGCLHWFHNHAEVLRSIL